MNLTMRWIIALVLTLPFSAAVHADEHAGDLPHDLPLVYEQTFDKPDSVKAYQFSDGKAWRFAKTGNKTGALELFGKSKYKTKVRSPFNISLIDGLSVGSFVLDVDMRQTGREYGHRDMCIFFNFTDPSKFYYIHIASTPDAHAHNVFIVNDKPRKAIADIPKQGIKWGQTWHKVRVMRNAESGDIKLYFDGKLIHHTKDKTFTTGMIGFGSFDDTGMVDNVRIWAPKKMKTDKKMFGK